MESEFCTCEYPKIEAVTDSEQHGGQIREVIVGYVCGDCNKPIDPSGIPDAEDDSMDDDDDFNADFEKYSNEGSEENHQTDNNGANQ